MYAVFENFVLFSQWLDSVNSLLGYPNGQTLTYTEALYNRDGVQVAALVDSRVSHEGLVIKTKDEIFALGWFEELRQEKHSKIDEKSRDMMRAGFQFNGETFSYSIKLYDDINTTWFALGAYINLFEYPRTIQTKNNSTYDLQDAAEAEAFVQTALGSMIAVFDSELSLKSAINNAQTIAELEAIVDER